MLFRPRRTPNLQEERLRRLKRQSRIQILQCLSTFYIPNDNVLSLVALPMISTYVGCSESLVTSIISELEHIGCVSYGPQKRSARLDPARWEAASEHCTKFRTLAWYVANAPACLRDENSLLPVRCGGCFVPQTEFYEGCSVTIVGPFNAPYNTFTSREFCCPPNEVPPLECCFTAKTCLSDRVLAMENLFTLASVVSVPAGEELLFRRELLLLYTTQVQGRSGAALADDGNIILFLENDQIIQGQSAADFLAIPGQAQGAQLLCTLFSGTKVVLDFDLGTATLSTEPKPRLFQDRGRTINGTQLVELGAKGSALQTPRLDPSRTLRACLGLPDTHCGC